MILAAQDFLSMAFADSGESEDEDGKRVDITKTSKAREQFKLSKALAVMGVKASTFHALYVGGKKDRVRKLWLFTDAILPKFAFCFSEIHQRFLL